MRLEPRAVRDLLGLARALGLGRGGGGAPAPPTATPPPPAPAQEGDTSVDTEAYAEISAFFARKRPQVTQCYNNAFADVDPGKRGKGYVTLIMEVLPSGKAENVRVAQSTLKSEAVETCLVGLVSRWILPRPAERMTFTFSYEFTPE